MGGFIFLFFVTNFFFGGYSALSLALDGTSYYKSSLIISYVTGALFLNVNNKISITSS